MIRLLDKRSHWRKTGPDALFMLCSKCIIGATKGVFVTTSAFSAEAKDYLKKVQHRVVLIDGSQLARLMIRHGVGVRDRLAYVIRSVDEDYFADPEG